ncbi:MAG TPA: hypothetical protein VJ724_12640 [Tahibacter sp.]|nr:hypothetical protein [Tahibacter sp.]
MPDFPFELPSQLRALIALGIWPARVHRDCVKAFAPDENELELSKPEHFRTVGSYLRDGRGLSPAQWAVHDIDPERTLLIADFELGSDSGIALDYRDDANEPSVIRLVWPSGHGQPNRWLEVAPTFDAFWAMIRLDSRPTPDR